MRNRGAERPRVKYTEKQTGGRVEGPRDRETETQRDRKTETQRDRETQRHKDREVDRQKHRGAEIWRKME